MEKPRAHSENPIPIVDGRWRASPATQASEKPRPQKPIRIDPVVLIGLEKIRATMLSHGPYIQPSMTRLINSILLDRVQADGGK
jgi:hypothetical protein